MKTLFAVLLVLQVATAQGPGSRVIPTITTVAIDEHSVTVLHLSPGYMTSVRLPEEITSVVLGNPATFKAEHSETEPELLFLKPITSQAAESNVLITTRSGQQISLHLISDNRAKSSKVDFILEYQRSTSLLIAPVGDLSFERSSARTETAVTDGNSALFNAVVNVLAKQESITNPEWQGTQLQIALGEPREKAPATILAFSLLNHSGKTVELVMPEIQLNGSSKAKREKTFRADSVPIMEYQISKWKLGPNERTDGVIVFERPEFKEADERLMLKIVEADQVDRPILIPIPFVIKTAGGIE